ncbi:hypothetical protein HH1059_03770 [Halorhodospira halochloris]|uniref:Uncharacterized protein n=1 Tax=Halorhodospira halochloris TaxID=1052 RepID=A0A0X8XBR2_HALHR|nr:hypothetical protein [Halorhodospira halochloris]BAU57054.1 hypothetical protein HH1059_03770 [Halorhodospira halochloris]
MRIRRIAILIDGGFFLKRLPKLVEPHFCDTPAATADSARHLCKRHVLRLGHTHKEGEWQIAAKLTKRLLKTRNWVERMEQVFLHGQALPDLNADEQEELARLISAWRDLDQDFLDRNFPDIMNFKARSFHISNSFKPDDESCLHGIAPPVAGLRPITPFLA